MNTGPWGSGTFKYDLLGNLRQQVLGTRTIDIDYNDSNRVSQFRDTAQMNNNWQSVAHDARGNVTARGALNLTYDAANQPITQSGAPTAPPFSTPGGQTGSGVFVFGNPPFEYPVTVPGAGTPPLGGGAAGGTQSYPYDGHLKRVKNVTGNETIYSVYSKVSGKISVIDNATSGEKFVILNLGPVSVRVKAGGTVEYTALDHLGSPVAATAANGALMWRESFNPFGEQRLSPAANDNKPGFTGHVDDAAIGSAWCHVRHFS